jgi:uncharacterized protein YndB with AHSA1/START domain
VNIDPATADFKAHEIPIPFTQYPMKYLLIAVLIIVGLLVLVTVAGAFMSRTHVATSEITLRQPIDTVYATLRDIGGMPKWWTDLKKSERVAGVAGERWRQEAGGFAMQLDVRDDSPPNGFTTHIVEEKGAPFGGKWIYKLVAVPGGTVVSITEDGWIGPPPFRAMQSVMGLHRTLDAVLVSLGKRFGEEVKPVHK